MRTIGTFAVPGLQVRSSGTVLYINKVYFIIRYIVGQGHRVNLGKKRGTNSGRILWEHLFAGEWYQQGVIFRYSPVINCVTLW